MFLGEKSEDENAYFEHLECIIYKNNHMLLILKMLTIRHFRLGVHLTAQQKWLHRAELGSWYQYYVVISLFSLLNITTVFYP